MQKRTAIRLSGLGAMAGAVLWALGDVLLVGGAARVEAYPLLLRDYAPRIPFGALPLMLGLGEGRLAAGALIPNFAVPLYLLGSWHLWQGLRPAGGWLPGLAFALMLCGNAISPLGHAAFYYPAMVYALIPEVPVAAHGALLDLGARFDGMVRIAWLAAVLTVGAGVLLSSVVIARGGTAYPRKAALILNPLVPLLVAGALMAVLPAPLSNWVYAGVLNVGFFVLYAVSTRLLWNQSR
ncbi:hypothetical protein MTR62_19010 [Novosphingobium sp. 1949]|uniref:Uncharacterized protein n=1 Tax=Novosphingobium organovorum TaxID=2930092 RepID=A0ABT0BI84_9SPHN|nr:DUF6796 family protein [Novosphingobium organovorum]MCJ2184762.1 hypothetical protein [Novosphingobium organovorum]